MKLHIKGWLVGCFGFNGPLRQYFSLYRAVSQREGERGERIDESKNIQTTPTRTYCKRNMPLPYCNPNCRTPLHWKFTQHHRTTRPPTTLKELAHRKNGMTSKKHGYAQIQSGESLLFLAHLNESTGNYCLQPGMDVGLGIGVIFVRFTANWKFCMWWARLAILYADRSCSFCTQGLKESMGWTFKIKFQNWRWLLNVQVCGSHNIHAPNSEYLMHLCVSRCNLRLESPY